MTANAITIGRVMLTFGVIALFGSHHSIDIGVLVVLPLIFALDAVDGAIARYRNETSHIGEILDTLADRLIENSFWIYFCATQVLPVWVPIVVMARGFITDGLQRLHGAPTRGWAYVLTRSRASRAVYGVIKPLAFTSLAGATVFTGPIWGHVSQCLAGIAVFVCLLRGLPFLFGKPSRER